LASNNKLTSEDICGGTITLSNIGAIGGKFGSPLVNLPEVSIIAIGKIQKVPRFADNGNVYPASLVTVSLAFCIIERTTIISDFFCVFVAFHFIYDCLVCHVAEEK